MALLLHYTGQDYISRGLLNTELTPGSTSAIVGGCKTGKGFAFDGTVNSTLSVLMTSEPIVHSFSLWFRITDITQSRFIVMFGQNDFLQFMLWQRTDGQLWFAYTRADGYTYGLVLNSNLPRNVWHHFAAAIDGRIMRLYLNGVLLQNHTASQDVRKGSDKTIRLGGYAVYNSYLLGQICNFKYYNHVLSQKEINEDYKSLMLHYKLDKPITTQVFDHSGFNRHINNLVNTKTNEAVGKVYGGSLKSVSGSVCRGGCNLTDWNGINEMSFACRFKVSELKQNYLFWNMNYTAAGSGFYAMANTSAIHFYLCGTSYLVNYNWIIDTWYSVVLVKSPTTIYIYVNNVLIDSIASTTSSFSYTYTTYIAERWEIPSYNLNGNIQDIRFYAKALTQEDVTELYQTRQEIDNLANGYCYELIEGQSEVEMKANGQLYCDEVIENDDGTFSINQNKTIKTKEIKEV